MKTKSPTMGIIIGVAVLCVFTACSGDGDRFALLPVHEAVPNGNSINALPSGAVPLPITPSRPVPPLPMPSNRVDNHASIVEITTTTISATPILPQKPTAIAPVSMSPTQPQPTPPVTSVPTKTPDTTATITSVPTQPTKTPDTAPTTTEITVPPVTQTIVTDTPIVTETINKPKIKNQTIPTNDVNVTLTELPYYENSGFGDVLISRDGKTYVHFDDTGISFRDMSDSDGVWHSFLNFPDYDGIQNYGVGSVAQDPAGEDVYYFCMGTAGAASTDSFVDYKIGLDMAAIFRTTDLFGSAERVSEHDTMLLTGLPNGIDYNANDDHHRMLQRYVMGCSGQAGGRYIYDQITNTESWWEMIRNTHLFAFDPRETVHVGDETVSKTFYFNTYLQGLARCTYDDTGYIDCDIIQNAAQYYDENAADYPWTDFIYYEYTPQTNDGATADERSQYAPVDGSCSFVTSDATNITGTLDATTGLCVEEEVQYVGTAVVVDPVSIDTTLNTADAPTVLYSGYLVNDLWTHGGLFRGIANADGGFDWTELKHPEDGTSLDVRDLVMDDRHTVTLAGGQVVAENFYVAAGNNGVFKGTVATDGAVTLTELHTGLYTRDDLHDDVLAGKSRDPYLCGGLADCGQFINIDMAYQSDGTVVLLTTEEGGGIHYAIDDHVSPVTWYRIWQLAGNTSTFATSTRDGALSETQQEEWAANGKNFSTPHEGSAIDPVTGALVIPDLYIYRVDSIDFTKPGMVIKNGKTYYGASGAFHAIHEGFGDRGGDAMYDPYTANQPDQSTRIHIACMDGGYDNFSYDADYKLDEDQTGKLIEDGLCLSAYTVPEGTDLNALDANGDSILDKSAASYTSLRQMAYGLFIDIVPKTGSSGDYVMYIAGNKSDDMTIGVVYRGDYDHEKGKFTFSLATGDKNCKAFYPYGNSNKNTCTYICAEQTDASDTPDGTLPISGPKTMAVDPNNSDHLVTVLWRKSDLKWTLYDSWNGGQSWNDRSAIYVDESGASLSDQGSTALGKVLVDPRDSDILYVLINNVNKLYMKDKGADFFTDITAMNADDNLASAVFTGQGTTGKYPSIYDFALVNEDGKTRAYLAANVFCDAGWGVYGTSVACGTIDGGLYTRLIGAEDDWTRLNTDGDVQNMTTYRIAISPVNAKHIVITGTTGAFGWGSMGNMADAIAGIAYSTDGVNFKRVTDVPLGATNPYPHPTDENKFIVKVEGSGLYELNLAAQ